MTSWSVPEGVPALGERSLHVWRVDVRQPDEVLRHLRATLTRDEEGRAALFRRERDRRAFECTRGALRVLAGSYLGIPAADVRFDYGAKGKPATRGLGFNVSHAGDVAVAAFTHSARVGVDVEVLDAGVALRALARRFFSDAESRALDRLDGDALVGGFYGCWTRKEALVKAVGDGISLLERAEVSVEGPARVVSVDGDPGAAQRWWMADLSPGDGYAGAVAAEGSGFDLALWDWRALEVAVG